MRLQLYPLYTNLKGENIITLEVDVIITNEDLKPIIIADEYSIGMVNMLDEDESDEISGSKFVKFHLIPNPNLQYEKHIIDRYLK